MFVLDRMLIGTIRFVLDKVVAAAAAEMDNEEGLRERLLEAQMRQELGEIDAEEFAAIEAGVIAALRDIKQRREGGGESAIPDGMEVVGASAEMSGDIHEHGERGDGEAFPSIEVALPETPREEAPRKKRLPKKRR